MLNRLSNRLLCLLTGWGMSLVVCLVLWRRSLYFAAGFVLFGVFILAAVCLVLLLYRPLRQVEQALCLATVSLETRIENIKNHLAPVQSELAQALLSLALEIRAQYTNILMNTQAELDTLQSQINPHFLYNTLDCIRGQAYQEGVEDIADMTEALSTFFRYSISNRNCVVTLEEELENIYNYFHIQQFRFGNRFRFLVLPAQREDLEQCRLPKLTLQPIVENAILHGMEGMLGGGTITIRIKGTENLVFVTISDDGMGMNGETLERLQAHVAGAAIETAGKRRGGLALPNVARRIRLLFGDLYPIQIMSTLGIGTDVVLTLPRSKEGI